MRLAFMGTPDFSVPALRALVDAGHDIAVVYSQPPRPAGRGKKDRPSPVHAAALELGLGVRTPEKLKGDTELGFLESLTLDAAVVVAYGQILGERALAAPKLGCLNIHASLLPRWRGAAPIQRAIMAGDRQTGVAIMQMEKGLDTGPVFLESVTDISDRDTAATLHDRLSTIGAQLIVDALEGIKAGTLRSEAQREDGVTYAHKIDKAEARIDWTRPAEAVKAHIHGLSPFPGAWCMIGSERVKLLEVALSDQTGDPGDVLDGRLTVACGTGAVKVLRVQRAGSRAMDCIDFLCGLPVSPGDRIT